MATDDTGHTPSTESQPGSASAPPIHVGRGRPTSWTSAIEASIIADIEGGDSERIAAEANGIPYSTFRQHKIDNEDFSTRCQAARAIGLRRIRRELLETDNPVRAKVRLHMLACKDRDEWSERKDIAITGTVTVAGLAALATTPDDSEAEA